MATSPLITKNIVTVEYLKDVVDLKDVVTNPTTYGILSYSPYQKVKVSWPKFAGSAGYNVYCSPSPIHKGNKVNTLLIGPNESSYTFICPVLPPTIVLNFWVARVNAIGGIHYLTDDPATEVTSRGYGNMLSNPLTPWAGIPLTGPLNTHMEYVFEEIRRRTRFQLENDGEEAWVYIRRFTGAPCNCYGVKAGSTPGDDDANSVFSSVLQGRQDDFAQVNDPDYQGRTRCLSCYGTGIVGGFYPKISIKIRYGNQPVQNVNPGRFGWQIIHNFDSYTLWSPRISTKDILVRSNGQRYEVTDSSWTDVRGGVILHQGMNLKMLAQTSIENQITDELIEKVTHEKAFLPEGSSIFG